MTLPGCSDQRPLQTGVLPILTNRSCLKTDLPNISECLNKTDGTREPCLHMSWLCARRVCLTWKDVPAKPSAFTAPPFAWLQLLLLPHFLSISEWTQTPRLKGLKGSQVFLLVHSLRQMFLFRLASSSHAHFTKLPWHPGQH